MKIPKRKYTTVYADPPWPERGGGRIVRGAQRHYSLMSVKDIMALPVQRVMLYNSHCYLWATNTNLQAGFDVLASWGYRYITTITWAKHRIGLGQYFRGQTEHCLFGVRGRILYRTRPDGKRAQGSTLLTAPRTAHSQKPEDMRRIIELVSPGPYLELFARTPHPGWAVWGDEVQSDINL